MSQLFTSGGQSIRVSALISPSNEYSRLISLKMEVLQHRNCQALQSRFLFSPPPVELLYQRKRALSPIYSLLDWRECQGALKIPHVLLSALYNP